MSRMCPSESSQHNKGGQGIRTEFKMDRAKPRLAEGILVSSSDQCAVCFAHTKTLLVRGCGVLETTVHENGPPDLSPRGRSRVPRCQQHGGEMVTHCNGEFLSALFSHSPLTAMRHLAAF